MRQRAIQIEGGEETHTQRDHSWHLRRQRIREERKARRKRNIERIGKREKEIERDHKENNNVHNSL